MGNCNKEKVENNTIFIDNYIGHGYGKENEEIEDTILGADEKAVALEYDIFSEIRNKVASQVERIKSAAYIISLIDVMQSMATVAEKNNYVKPVVNNGNNIDIKM